MAAHQKDVHLSPSTPLKADAETSFEDVEDQSELKLRGGIDQPENLASMFICASIFTLLSNSTVGGVLIWQSTKLKSASCHDSLVDIVLAYGIFMIAAGVFTLATVLAAVCTETKTDDAFCGCLVLLSAFGNLACLIGTTAMAWGGEADGCPDDTLGSLRITIIVIWCLMAIDCILNGRKSMNAAHAAQGQAI
mmetsp:Transcript_23944/g.46673  ORF Transcript_23944/g.46673 Transcript_23944/m.46673 type:complete len:193 (-) Transcript_23944:246-824(-)